MGHLDWRPGESLPTLAIEDRVEAERTGTILGVQPDGEKFLVAPFNITTASRATRRGAKVWGS